MRAADARGFASIGRTGAIIAVAGMAASMFARTMFAFGAGGRAVYATGFSLALNSAIQIF